MISTKLTKQQFFSSLAPSALIAFLQGSPIYPSVRIANSYIKSNGIYVAWNNFISLKVGDGQKNPYWQGDYIKTDTMELKRLEYKLRKIEGERAYRTIYYSFKDEDKLFGYEKCKAVVQSINPYVQVEALVKLREEQMEYADRLNAFIRLYQLEFYDKIDTFYDKPPYVVAEDIIPVMYKEELISLIFQSEQYMYTSLRKLKEYFTFKEEKKNGVLKINGYIVKSFCVGQVCYVSIEDLEKILLFEVEWDCDAKVLFLS